MEFDQDSMMADSIIQTFKSMTKLKEQLRYVLVLLYQLDSKGQKQFQDDILKLEKYLSDLKFMRSIGERDAIVEEYPREYFGRDYSYDDPFIYKQKLESHINKIELYLLSVIGMIIKYLKQDSIVIGDST
jgi:hypothetical protein